MAHPNGLLAWADVALPDLAAGTDFYRAVMGWEAEEVPGSQGTYFMFKKNGEKAAGLGLLSEEDVASGIPSVWSTYVAVDDVDSVAGRAAELGGNVMMPPMDVLEAGRMTFVIDPTGAMIGFWQAGQHAGADRFNDPGFMSWNDLATNDVDAAVAFYSGLLGWQPETHEFEGGFVYTTMMLGERQNGGMYDMSGSFPEGIPPHWGITFSVADTDATAATARAEGGTVIREPSDSQFGRVASIIDSQGAAFSIIRLAR